MLRRPAGAVSEQMLNAQIGQARRPAAQQRRGNASALADGREGTQGTRAWRTSPQQSTPGTPGPGSRPLPTGGWQQWAAAWSTRIRRRSIPPSQAGPRRSFPAPSRPSRSCRRRTATYNGSFSVIQNPAGYRRIGHHRLNFGNQAGNFPPVAQWQNGMTGSAHRPLS